MDPYDIVREQITKTVPFASHTGVVLTHIADGEGIAELQQNTNTSNHIGTQHAGALFTLGEAASGAAMAGAFLSVLLSVRPVAGRAQIEYLKVAKGTIIATAKTGFPSADLLAKLEADGKVAFAVTVSLTDDSGTEVAKMTVDWHLKKK